LLFFDQHRGFAVSEFRVEADARSATGCCVACFASESQQLIGHVGLMAGLHLAGEPATGCSR
jgi:hypothetical protein